MVDMRQALGFDDFNQMSNYTGQLQNKRRSVGQKDYGLGGKALDMAAALGDVAAPEGTEYLREKLYQGEDDYFKDNPNVAGMAAEDNKVILNPYSKNSKEEQGAVYSNELSRIAMRVSKDKPTFALTPEQVEQFRGTAYEGNDDAMRQTIASRIYSNDPSAGRPTDEQMQYADKLKGMVNMMQNNQKTNYAEGGMIDPVSGNKVPLGAFPQEVRDGESMVDALSGVNNK